MDGLLRDGLVCRSRWVLLRPRQKPADLLQSAGLERRRLLTDTWSHRLSDDRLCRLLAGHSIQLRLRLLWNYRYFSRPLQFGVGSDSHVP
jgi:hypothetical protein